MVLNVFIHGQDHILIKHPSEKNGKNVHLVFIIGHYQSIFQMFKKYDLIVMDFDEPKFFSRIHHNMILLALSYFI